ncbi:hypothetical protein AMJ57_03705 [Parcubacteria bacterium SG8_24]|nr:MAG: hypothetical protein AMJ57_03705 [Parcubacteria bacterium SG8_24]
MIGVAILVGAGCAPGPTTDQTAGPAESDLPIRFVEMPLDIPETPPARAATETDMPTADDRPSATEVPPVILRAEPEPGQLLEFYGAECPHCVNMMPLVKQLEQETGVDVIQFEVWHDADNAAKMREYDQGYCGGVPFFFNTGSGQWLCGGQSYDKLRAWATK